MYFTLSCVNLFINKVEVSFYFVLIFTFRKWKEQHEQELKEKAKNAEERQLRARERAKQELQEFMEQRTKEIQSRKILNRYVWNFFLFISCHHFDWSETNVSNVVYREKEAAFLKSREAVRSEDRVWEHVSHLIESIAKDLASTSPSSKRTAESDTVESNNNTNLNTSDQKLRVVKKDTTRMRELLRVPPSTSTATLS